jgi:tetratricopeptide (TPR) repeat protein
MVEYDAGEFDKALEDATRAYELDPRPELLFNLGQCHRALGHWQQAEFFYRGFLRQRPDSEARAKVEKLVDKMVAKQQELAPPAAPAEPLIVPVPVPTPPPLPSDVAPPAPVASVVAPPSKPRGPSLEKRIPTGAWLLAGASLGCFIAGGALGAAATVTQSGDHTSPDPAGGGLVDHSISLATLHRANIEAETADGLLIAGGVLAISAIAWALIAPRHPVLSPEGVLHF